MSAVRFDFMTMKPLDNAASNDALLAAFEPDFTPTHAGTDEHAREAYQRARFVAAIVAVRGTLGGVFQECGIARKKAPKYTGFFWSRSADEPSYFTLELDKLSSSQLAPALALADRLAAALELDYGTAHLTFPEATDYYNAGGLTAPKDLQKLGPMPLGARTWLGPHLVELIGKDQLEQSGGLLHETSWGALRVDLLDDLPNQSMAALQAKQLEVMARLQPTGVFALFDPEELTKKGPRWKPLT